MSSCLAAPQSHDRSPFAFTGRSHGECLLLGHDKGLLRTRSMVLVSVGFRCHTQPAHLDPAKLREAHLVLAILCHTLSDEEARRAAELLNGRMPFTPVLRLCTAPLEADNRFDRVLVAPSPERLLAEVHRLSVLGILRRIRHLAIATAAAPVLEPAREAYNG